MCSSLINRVNFITLKVVKLALKIHAEVFTCIDREDSHFITLKQLPS